jgi:hypothetical protein
VGTHWHYSVFSALTDWPSLCIAQRRPMWKSEFENVKLRMNEIGPDQMLNASWWQWAFVFHTTGNLGLGFCILYLFSFLCFTEGGLQCRSCRTTQGPMPEYSPQTLQNKAANSYPRQQSLSVCLISLGVWNESCINGSPSVQLLGVCFIVLSPWMSTS